MQEPIVIVVNDMDCKKLADWSDQIKELSEKEQVSIVELFWCLWEQSAIINLQEMR